MVQSWIKGMNVYGWGEGMDGNSGLLLWKGWLLEHEISRSFFLNCWAVASSYSVNLIMMLLVAQWGFWVLEIPGPYAVVLSAVCLF